MTRTFKVLLCSAVLSRVGAGEESLSRQGRYKADDLVTYSPVTEVYVDYGMSVGDLCEATITISDNAAGNLLPESVGGPQGLTEFFCAVSATRQRASTDGNRASLKQYLTL